MTNNQPDRNSSGEIPPRRRRRKSKVHPELKKFSFVKECAIILVLCIVVPTFDVYSDGALTYQLFTDPTHFQCRNGQIIRVELVNDNDMDCWDGSDESDLPGLWTLGGSRLDGKWKILHIMFQIQFLALSLLYP